jgi:diguanylate cyclase (GGDEF)-like protein
MEVIRALRYNHPLFLFFFDVDFFKIYNDQKGHQAGDELLVQMARVLETSIREDVDSAFRYGGDEFLVLLPYLPEEQAALVAERIRENYNRLQLVPTSLSAGVARFRQAGASIDDDVDDLIHRADKALYHAKHDLGRNRVHFDE